MIPILYSQFENDFTNNGIGMLAECLSCKATQERNGINEMVFTYPTTGLLIDYIDTDCLIKAKPDLKSNPQIYRIYDYQKQLNGVVKFYCEHISYALNAIPIDHIKITNKNAATALNNLLSATEFQHNFIAESDITTVNSAEFNYMSVRSCLAGTNGSILDRFGGEFEFDNFKIILHNSRGTDSGIRISYGKNLQDVKYEKNTANIVSGIMGFAKKKSENSEERMIKTSPRIINCQHGLTTKYPRILIKDFSSFFDDGETINPTTLATKVSTYINSNSIDLPTINITVSFNNNDNSLKYLPLQTLGLCDIVHLYINNYSIVTQAKIVKTVFDVLKERYETIQIGTIKPNFADEYISKSRKTDTVIYKLQDEIDEILV